jgi:hypothetical protein
MGVAAGAAGPKRTIQERLPGFPGLTTSSRICSQHAIKRHAVRLAWNAYQAICGHQGGGHACGAETLPFGFEDGKPTNSPTIRDRFPLLRQIGYLPGEASGVARARRPLAAEHQKVPCTCGGEAPARGRPRALPAVPIRRMR